MQTLLHNPTNVSQYDATPGETTPSPDVDVNPPAGDPADESELISEPVKFDEDSEIGVV